MGTELHSKMPIEGTSGLNKCHFGEHHVLSISGGDSEHDFYE